MKYIGVLFLSLILFSFGVISSIGHKPKEINNTHNLTQCVDCERSVLDLKYALNSVIEVRSACESENKHLRNELYKLKKELDFEKSKKVSTCEFVIPKTRDVSIHLSRKQLQHFLRFDNTNGKKHSKNFQCADFSNELIRKLWDRGVFSCMAIVYMNNNTMAHALVAVNTTDFGVVYVEPQTDDILLHEELVKVYPTLDRVTSCYGGI